MLIALWLLLGLLLGTAFLVFARTKQRGERRFLAVSLVVVALVYVGFATAGGASAVWLGLELLSAVFYGALAWAGLRSSLWWLAVGWMAHPAWDVVLHYFGNGSEFTPAWFAIGCVSFDFLVAAYLAVQAWERPNTAFNPAAQKPRAS